MEGVFESIAKPLAKAGGPLLPEGPIGFIAQWAPPSVVFETPQTGGPLGTNWQIPAAYIVVGVSGSKTRTVAANGPKNGAPSVTAGVPSGIQFWPRSLLT